MVNELRMLLLILVACFSLMLTGISHEKIETVLQRATPVAVGETAPDFTLEDQNGKKFSLSESRGQNPVVLVFYRGYWWPFCARQLAGLRTLLKKNENAKLFALSVDPPDVSKNFAEKIGSDGKGAINFPILSDPEHKIIDAYGLRDPAYEGQKVYGIPHPAVYVIDKQGKVAWAKIESDYKQRPTNEEIRAALDSLKWSIPEARVILS